MKRVYLIYLSITLLFFNSSFAILKLELTKASSSSIAVKINKHSNSPVLSNLEKIITHDLMSSGYVHTVSHNADVEADLSYDEPHKKVRVTLYDSGNKNDHDSNSNDNEHNALEHSSNESNPDNSCNNPNTLMM